MTDPDHTSKRGELEYDAGRLAGAARAAAFLVSAASEQPAGFVDLFDLSCLIKIVADKAGDVHDSAIAFLSRRARAA